MNDKDDNRTKIQLKMSTETHKRIKIYCVQRGISMQSALESMLEKAFAGVHMPPPPPGPIQ
jgi:predicted DNA binding CopG/RHH family protein